MKVQEKNYIPLKVLDLEKVHFDGMSMLDWTAYFKSGVKKNSLAGLHKWRVRIYLSILLRFATL